ncbi:glycosyltransferase [Methylobacterium aquaticum]|jgi:glycosyltransferase involved in cell wall biosynthesis|uniref:Glycosyl transferase family 1 n=1 Tax=Methylobacterium aquaticum TaxID=270351 RepID=A0A0J6S7B3_9HYPH|nr:glycosyltransferase family 4 protein [Methylobacterium aquaticum]KMO31110.1 glycosyl transferase family 1 [Methylobacterium aquaticum]
MSADRPVVVVTGALAPYTQVLYRALASVLDRPLTVLACAAREPARQWELAAADGYGFAVLPGLRWHRDAVRNLYVNPSVVPRLAALRPAAVILNDFSPTMAMAALAARALGIPYAIRTDGVPETDPGARSPAHRLLRRTIVPGAAFGLAPSDGSRTLLSTYGLAQGRVFRAPLFPAWDAAPPLPDPEARPYDVLFCGILNEEVKGARFFTDVMRACAAAGRPLRVRVAGDGPLRGEMAARLAEAGIPARFDGYLAQGALAEAHASARLLLFPSRGDVWGLVVNEALQSGACVLASPHSGAARELLEARGCGTVRPMDVADWARTTLALLDDPGERARLRAAAERALPDFALPRAVEAYRAGLAAAG